MALLVPNSIVAEGYHYVLTIPSVMTAVWWARQSRTSVTGLSVLAIAVGLLALPIPFKSPVLAHGWLALMAFPRVYGAYLLWVWLLWQLKARPVEAQRGSGLNGPQNNADEAQNSAAPPPTRFLIFDFRLSSLSILRRSPVRSRQAPLQQIRAAAIWGWRSCTAA